MKLAELLDRIYNDDSIDIVDYTIGPDILMKFKDEISATDEFINADVTILRSRYNSSLRSSICSKMGSESRYYGSAQIHSINLTAQVIDMDTKKFMNIDHSAMKHYDLKTFDLNYKVIMTFPVDKPSTDESRKMAHEQLDAILDDPDRYRMHNPRGVLITGIFRSDKNTCGTGCMVVHLKKDEPNT